MQGSGREWGFGGTDKYILTLSTFYYLLTSLQIRRGGRWNADQMTGCYLTTLPRQFMRGMADFKPDFASSYFLPRETVLPPLSLLRKVWPELDMWQDAYYKRPGTTELVEENLAAGAFLQLLQKLRIVFLQVSTAYKSSQDLTHPLYMILI